MSRALRVQYEGAYYHVACRGNERRNIFRDNTDRVVFLSCLERSAEIYDVRVLCYVLMDNHFHLLIQTLKANLSEFMRHFNISYTGAFNRRHKRVGHLYQGRYHAILVEKDSYLMEVSRYLHLNPVRVKTIVAKSPEEKKGLLSKFLWSSYRGYVSSRRRPSFLDCSDVLDYFGGDDVKGRRQYAIFVKEGIGAEVENPFEEVVGQLVLGGEEFVERIKERFLSQEQKDRETPALRSIPASKNPAQVIDAAAGILGLAPNRLIARGKATVERGLVMELLYRHCGMTQPQIGQLMGDIYYSTVSRSRKKFLERLKEDEHLRTTFCEITSTLNENMQE